MGWHLPKLWSSCSFKDLTLNLVERGALGDREPKGLFSRGADRTWDSPITALMGTGICTETPGTAWVFAANLGNPRDSFLGPDSWSITANIHRPVRSGSLAFNPLPLLVHRKMLGVEAKVWQELYRMKRKHRPSSDFTMRTQTSEEFTVILG